MIRARSLAAVSLVVLSSMAPAHAALAEGPIVGTVEGGEVRAFPIAIPDARVEGGEKAAGAELMKIVRDDLAMSGAFKILDGRSFIDTDGLTGAAVRFADWQNVGAQGLVKTKLVVDGKKLSLELHGFEVAAQREGLTKTLAGSRDDVRALAHVISDEVFRFFTGEPGVFRTQIAVVKKVQGEKQLFVMDADGQNVRQVTKGGGLNLLPTWSPDGRALLFTSYRFDNPDLFELTLADGNVKALSRRPGLNIGGRVSPDGGQIALTLSQDGNSEIYLLDRAGNVVRRLTNQWGIDTSPSWSPDGKSIAFVSTRGGHPDLYLMDVSAGSARRLTFRGDYNQTPVFSPRGTHIAFTARDERNHFDIFVLELKSGEIKRVTQDQGNNEDPSFAPNGRMLVFTTTRNGSRQLVVSTLDGTQQTVLPSAGEHTTPSWGPLPR